MNEQTASATITNFRLSGCLEIPLHSSEQLTLRFFAMPLLNFLQLPKSTT